MKKSIIPGGNDERCYLCGSWICLERHHVMHGTANRKIAEKYGLTVNLCKFCHTHIHDDANFATADEYLKQTAQKSFEEKYSHELWMKEFGRNYL